MKCLLLAAAVLGLATAKPEGTYKETEDFQYSRSSSDAGSKSGFYGAQRGNTGGNYEKAHNMDALAQNQMNSLVSQVDGDLGDGSKMRAGNVYTSANSQGVYGAGRRYDFSHLGGRNFQDGERQGNFAAESQTSQNSGYSGQASSATHSSGYSSSDSRYQSSNSAAQSLQSSQLKSANNDQYNYGTNLHGYSAGSGYNSQSEYQGAYGNTKQQYSDGVPIIRLVSGAPARVVIRPAGTVMIPVAAQSYNGAYGSSGHFDQNAINSEAEVLHNNNQQTSYKPSSNAKHYESSSSYRKQWEKHFSEPVAVPTASPYPRNSELYDDSQRSYTSHGHNQAYGYNDHSSQVHDANYRYNSNSQSAQSQSLQNSDYNSQQSSRSTDTNTHGHEGYNYGSTDADTKPKSYQSSYSYHKAWERQGEPYEIKFPETSTEGQTSQRLTADSNRKGYSANQYGSQYRQRYGHGCTIECDENGHLRVARSVRMINQETPYVEELGPRAPDGGQEYLNIGQQYQDDYGNIEQSGWSQSKDAGQKTQDLFINDVEPQFHSQNNVFEIDTQQTQNGWNNLHESQLNGLEDAGQHTQHQWDKLEELGQQIQNLGQQEQTTWDLQKHGQNSENLGFHEQQFENTWNKVNLGQEEQTSWLHNQEQQEQSTWDLGKHGENSENLGVHEQQFENTWDKVNLGQEQQNTWQDNQGQLEQSTWDLQKANENAENLGVHEQQFENTWDKVNVGQEQQTTWQQNQGQLEQSTWDLQKPGENVENLEDHEQQFENTWDKINLGQEQQTTWQHNQGQMEQSTWDLQKHGENPENLGVHDSQLANTWDKINLGQEQTTWQHKQDAGAQTALHDLDQTSQTSQKEIGETLESQDGKNNIWNRVDGYNTFNIQQNTQNVGQVDDINQNNAKEGFDQQSGWNQFSQTADNLGQSTQGLWDTLNTMHKNSQTPWEQSNTNADATYTSIFNNNHKISNNYNDDSHYNDNDFHKDTQFSYANWDVNNSSHSNQHIPSQSETSSSLDNLWNKINKFDKDSSMATGNNFENEHSVFSQNTTAVNVNNNWSETQQTENKSFEHSHFPTTYDTNENPTSTLKPKEQEESGHNVEKLHPQDIGRGDIGPEETISTDAITTHSNSVRPQINNSKEYKTPDIQKIESLSSTKENESRKKGNTTKLNDLNNGNFENDLSVLSINEQKQFEELSPAASNTQKNTYTTSTTIANYNKNVYSANGDVLESNLKANTYHRNNEYDENRHVSVDSNTERIISNQGSLAQDNSNIEQGVQSEYTEQLLHTKNFESQNENLDNQFDTELGTENLDKQSQSTWGENLRDFGQDTQKLWEPNLELQQQDTQQFERSHEGNYQTDNFYKERYHNTRQQPMQTVETLPQTVEKLDKAESVTQNVEVEIIAPQEPTTEKAGFWKSVGNKFGSAKNTVSSWFKRS